MRYIRSKIPGATYFFTVNLANRSHGILIKKINILRNAIQITKTRYPFKINAYVILPDHIHLMMTLPEDDRNFSIRWSMIKSCFSQKISPYETISASRKKKRERAIWQRRFWEHLIRDEKDYEQHVNYIHFNPVRHGYVNKPSHWKYSSIHHYILEKVIPEDWTWHCPAGSDHYGEWE